jgi:hypothetical protein
VRPKRVALPCSSIFGDAKVRCLRHGCRDGS